MNRFFWVKLSFLFLFPVGLFSQKDSTTSEKGLTPVEPLLELPSVLLELEDRVEEKVETILPLPALPLPQESSFSVPEAKSPEIEAFKMEAKEELLLSNLSKESHYFEFLGGIGSLASLMGDFTWYYFARNGFSSQLKFSHRNDHFWNYLPADQQGQSRREEIDWGLAYKEQKHQLHFRLNYREQQSWLQNQIENIDSSIWRNLLLENDYQYQIDEFFASFFDWSFESWIQTEDYAQNPQSSILFDPRIGLTFKGENYSFLLHFDYHLNYTDSLKKANHYWGVLGDFSIDLPYQLTLGGTIGVSYDSHEGAIAYSQNRLAGFQLPFAVELSGKLVDWFFFEMRGGYERYREPFEEQLGKVLPFIDYIDFCNQESWFFHSNLHFFIPNQVELFAGLEYRKKGNGFIFDSFSNTESPSGLLSLSLHPVESLYLQGGLKAYYLDLVDFSFRYQGEFLSPYSLPLPEHQLAFSLDYKIPSQWFGGSFLFQFDVYEEVRIPEISLGFFFEVAKGYRLWFKGKDLLAPIYGEKGRPVRWNFKDKGAQVALLAEISL